MLRSLTDVSRRGESRVKGARGKGARRGSRESFRGGSSTPPYKLVNRHGGAGSARSKWPFGHLSLSLRAHHHPPFHYSHYCNPIVLNKLRSWAGPLVVRCTLRPLAITTISLIGWGWWRLSQMAFNLHHGLPLSPALN